ncbi:hypothetical protein SO802_009244 [Lithocarpus litseifolius]|uniref:Uncharacterized protein n=1 Tax=Lithocarpus litseifolius TaxID=425828 RepID=A0AAW2DD11_9ROSI
MSNRRSDSYIESGSAESSRGSTWREQRHKRHEDRYHERVEEQFGKGEGSRRTHQTVSGATEHKQFDERDEELERLRRLVRNLELEAEGGCRRENQERRERMPGGTRDR